MRILFMGTPDIAAECLKALYAAGHDICAVYTRRDKPVGRKQVLTAPPVKEVALAHGTPVFQPRTLRDGSEDENIRALAPELIVVVAYGCILPKSVLEAPKYGCINLHVSLLPKYRGSAPVQWAVLNGDAETGLRGVLSKDNDVPLYVPAAGAKGSTKWADKTEDEILADITGMLKQVARTTKKVEKPDTLALPSEAYIEIQNRRIESTATTVLKYVQDNIKDIARIVSCPELDPDSVDTNPYAAESDGKGVALLFKNDPRKFTIENPLSFMQYPVQPEGLEMVVPCEARTAGAIIYYPMSMLIATGIC